MAASDHLGGQFDGPMYHGSRYSFKPGQVLTGGHMPSNQGAGTPGDHVYMSARPEVAARFGSYATGPQRNPDARPRLYEVEPMGHVEADPGEDASVQSYRSQSVRVVRSLPHAQWDILPAD